MLRLCKNKVEESVANIDRSEKNRQQKIQEFNQEFNDKYFRLGVSKIFRYSNDSKRNEYNWLKLKSNNVSLENRVKESIYKMVISNKHNSINGTKFILI